jgi:hypothetical protein
VFFGCFLDRARWMQIPSIAKPPDDVRSAVTNRPCQVLEMDVGARGEEISQELTEGGAFRTRPWFLCGSEFRVSSLREALRKENVLIFLASCLELLISMKEMNTSLLVRDSATNKDVFISYVEKAIINLYCFHYHG